MSETRSPTRLARHKRASLALSSVVVLALADSRTGPERIIDKPSSRAATAFVPRLGKRMADGPPMDALSRLLCSSSVDCNQLVLLGALVRGVAAQDGDSNLLPTDQLEGIVASNGAPALSAFDSTNEDGLRLLRMLHRDQLLRRDTRGTSEGADEMIGKYAESKRLAFTPRIGRRRR